MPQPIGRDLDQTRKQLEAWLGRQLPDSGRASVENLRGPKDTGFSSDTLMFELHSQEDGKDTLHEMVARLAPAGDFGIFPEYDVALQFNMMRSLGDTAVPVPRMFWLEEDPGPLGTPFYVMEKLDGQVPSDSPPYHAEGWIHDLPEAGRKQMWESGLDAMAAVHQLDWQKPEFGFIPRPPAGVSPIQAQLDYWERYLDWGMDRPRYELLNTGMAWLQANQPTDEPAGICWGDSRISNQIFRDNEVIAVIDWEMVFIGNPVADLAWFITMDRTFTQGIGIPRLPGIPDKDETIARWEARVSRSADNYAYYEIFSALRFAAIMSRLFLQMKYYEVLPEDAPVDIENLSTPVLREVLQEVGAV
jgi:aminoglycoside phosphotransferase (APT) family kinase protein